MRALMTGRKTRRNFLLLAGIAAAVAVAIVIWWHGKSQTARAEPPAVPVTMTTATQRDVPIYFDALGTVMAFNTVAIKAQVSGQIIGVDFRQGQDVKKGDVLARIDQAPFRATLDQAVAKKADDEAQLVDAQKDLQRFTTLAKRDFETQQNVDTQQAKVDHFKAAIDSDQAAIEAAQIQLNYATIVAPIDGVVGFRQVDVGNTIQPNDPNPFTVLTQIKPSYAVFTLPQSDLGAVREAMLAGPVTVLAFDQNDEKQLAAGELLLINNQIDQATSTIQLKAQFANEAARLWPGEFVRIRILISTRKDAVTIPPLALQRGPEGFYVWVIKPDNTVEQRPIDAKLVGNDTAIASKGLNAGEHVVLNGQSRLDVGVRVTIRGQSPPPQTTEQQADKS
jgi:membrane fusion protein, multidrug efflux system